MSNFHSIWYSAGLCCIKHSTIDFTHGMTVLTTMKMKIIIVLSCPSAPHYLFLQKFAFLLMLMWSSTVHVLIFLLILSICVNIKFPVTPFSKFGVPDITPNLFIQDSQSTKWRTTSFKPWTRFFGRLLKLVNNISPSLNLRLLFYPIEYIFVLIIVKMNLTTVK